MAREKTCRDLLEAAARLFRERGYVAVTIRDLANEMDKSTGAIFAHFPSKEAVWLATMNSPLPDIEMSEKLALLQSEHPGCGWTVAWTPDGVFEAGMTSPTGAQQRARGLTGGAAVQALLDIARASSAD